MLRTRSIQLTTVVTTAPSTPQTIPMTCRRHEVTIERLDSLNRWPRPSLSSKRRHGTAFGWSFESSLNVRGRRFLPNERGVRGLAPQFTGRANHNASPPRYVLCVLYERQLKACLAREKFYGEGSHVLCRYIMRTTPITCDVPFALSSTFPSPMSSCLVNHPSGRTQIILRSRSRGQSGVRCPIFV